MKASKVSPEKKSGFWFIIIGFVFWGSLPWLVMAVGLETGNVQSVFHYFWPDMKNPYHLAFFLSVIFIWSIGSLWLFRGGAEKLMAHNELFGSRKISASGIKIQWSIAIIGGVIAFTMMWLGLFPKLIS